MCFNAEKPRTDEPQRPFSQAMRVTGLHLPPRRRKETFLPEITQLALQGDSGRAIARKLELPERTVNHWLRELRQEWTAKAAEDVAKMLALALARLESIYREAMEAFAPRRRTRKRGSSRTPRRPTAA